MTALECASAGDARGVNRSPRVSLPFQMSKNHPASSMPVARASDETIMCKWTLFWRSCQSQSWGIRPHRCDSKRAKAFPLRSTRYPNAAAERRGYSVRSASTADFQRDGDSFRIKRFTEK